MEAAKGFGRFRTLIGFRTRDPGVAGVGDQLSNSNERLGCQTKITGTTMYHLIDVVLLFG